MTATGALLPLGIGLATSQSAEAATAAPVNGPIVFTTSPSGSMSGGMYSQNANGSGQTLVDTVGACAAGANLALNMISYSPDGTKAVLGCSGPSIRVAQADLRRATEIFTDTVAHGTTVLDTDPIWSPDGTTIYFTRIVLGGTVPTMTAWSVHVDGTQAGPVANVPAGAEVTSVAPNGALLISSVLGQNGVTISILDPGAAAPHPVVSGQILGPATMSPDGTKIAVGQSAGGGNGLDLYSYNVDGTNPKALAIGTANGTGITGRPVWSPDSKQIAYAWTVPNNASATPPVTAFGEFRCVPADGSAGSTLINSAPGAVSVEAWHNGPIPSPPRPTVTRLAGGDRIATSVAVADAAYNPARPGTAKASVAVISRQDNYADALPGNALAAQKHGPLLLAGATKLDPTVAAELKTILAPGSVVYILGGEKALSPQIIADITALGLSPHRLSGDDRFATATTIAAEISPHPHTVLVATGTNYPDALAAGAAAANDPQGGVVLLTNDGKVPAATQNYLAGVDPSSTKVYGVGGQGVTALNALPGFAGRFTPLQGNDRWATDMAVASSTALFPNISAVGVATGTNWPDALSGGAYAGAQHAPLLLVDNGGGTAAEMAVIHWLNGHSANLAQLTVFGGQQVVQDGILHEVGDSAFGTGNWDRR
jgi:hypothetical protein